MTRPFGKKELATLVEQIGDLGVVPAVDGRPRATTEAGQPYVIWLYSGPRSEQYMPISARNFPNLDTQAKLLLAAVQAEIDGRSARIVWRQEPEVRVDDEGFEYLYCRLALEPVLSVGAVLRGETATGVTVDELMKPVAEEWLLQFFGYLHLPPLLQDISQPFSVLADTLARTLPRNLERTVALRKLLEAKDCAVRAAVAKGR